MQSFGFAPERLGSLVLKSTLLRGMRALNQCKSTARKIPNLFDDWRSVSACFWALEALQTPKRMAALARRA